MSDKKKPKSFIRYGYNGSELLVYKADEMDEYIAKKDAEIEYLKYANDGAVIECAKKDARIKVLEDALKYIINHA